jgi:hypothetical protein
LLDRYHPSANSFADSLAVFVGGRRYNKLVQKGFGRLLCVDALVAAPTAAVDASELASADRVALAPFASLTYEQSLEVKKGVGTTLTYEQSLEGRGRGRNDVVLRAVPRG